MLRLSLRLVCALGALLLPLRAHPQDSEGRRSPIARTTEPPEIDGLLDDPAWRAATVMTDLRQYEPVSGAQASERTEIRALYDRDFFYLAVRCYDRDPDAIIAKVLKRDASLQSDDRITFNIDTFHDQRNGYMLSVNPNGARWDALISNLDVQSEWNGIWYAKARIDAEGWTAEIAIPAKTINFDPGSETWGFNLMRAIRRRNEIVRWTAWSQNFRFGDLGPAGVLEGFGGMEQGLGIDVKPSFFVKRRNDRTRREPPDPRAGEARKRVNTNVEPSGDVFYKFTPALTGVLTANTDFSETEADDRLVNLTQFSLFFPEKRDFFLQDAGIFNFAGVEANAQAFDSRRMGIVPDNQTVDIRVGAKLTGRAGPWTIGLIETRMASGQAAVEVTPLPPGPPPPFPEFENLEGKYLGVFRLERNFWEESRIGMIATHGDPERNADNRNVGVDLNLRTSRFRGDQVVTGTLWTQRSHSSDVDADDPDPDIDGSGNAWGFKLDYPNDRIDTNLALKVIDTNFNPALGFVNRPNVRDWTQKLRYRWRPNNILRTVDTGWDLRWVQERPGTLDAYRYDLEYLELANQAGDMLNLGYIWRMEDIDAPFEITDDITIPIEKYRWDRAQIFLSTTPSRPLRTELNLLWGSFFNGRRYTMEALVEWRPNKHVLTSLDWEQNELRQLCCTISGGKDSFTTRVVRLRFDWSWTPDLTWTNFIQYDNVTDDVDWNSRLQWIIEPGKEFFIVINPGFSVNDRQHLDSADSEAIVKLRWTFRY